jgi:hypothetical protein
MIKFSTIFFTNVLYTTLLRRRPIYYAHIAFQKVSAVLLMRHCNWLHFPPPDHCNLFFLTAKLADLQLASLLLPS